MVFGYCSTIMLGGKGQAKRAYEIADIFQDHLYDQGFAGLVRNCWEVLHDME